MKKIIIFTLAAAGIGIAVVMYLSSSSSNAVAYDLTENLEISVSGWNGAGSAEVSSNKIAYDEEDEAMQRFVESLDYVIDPADGLSNGDTVTVRVRYNDEYRRLANLTIANDFKEFVVSGLDGEDIVSYSEDHFVVDGEGNIRNDWQSVEVIDGIEIPSSWGLSDEEKELYVQYQKIVNGDTEKDTAENEDAAAVGWMQGESESTTNRQTSSFWFSDYNDDSIKTYDAAYIYGNTSSQRYRISPIMIDGEHKGYRTIFEGDDDE